MENLSIACIVYVTLHFLSNFAKILLFINKYQDIMQVTKTELPKNSIELTFTVTLEELQPFLQEAAKELTTNKPIEGFRPGKAPYDVVKQKVGEMTIFQHATNAVIAKKYYEYIDEQKMETVDQPDIEVIKLAPDNDFIFKAKVSIMPEVELCDYKTLKIKATPKVEATKEEVDKVIEDLRKMRSSEKAVERAVQTGDKAEINFETFIDTVAIAGGKAEKYALMVGEGHMIPGFEEEVIGLKKGDNKEFELSFPKKYHESKIAGKKAKFKVEVLEVFEKTLPEMNEEFLKTLGIKSKDDLEKQIKQNLEHEKTHKDMDKKDLEMVSLLIDKTNFGELPDTLVNSEAHKMLEELKDNVAKQGLEFDAYLSHIKKTEGELKLDFAVDAVKRVKTSILIRKVADKEKIETNDQEIDFERDRTLQSYEMNPAMAAQLEQIKQNIMSADARRYFSNVIVNRKVMEHLRCAVIEGHEGHGCGHDHEGEESTESKPEEKKEASAESTIEEKK